MVDQVGKGAALDRHPEGCHVGEIGLAQLPGLVDLREIGLLGRSFQRSPDLDAALQGAQLAIGKAARLPELQVLEQTPRLQTRIIPKHVLELRPHLLEGIRTGAPGVLNLQLVGQAPGIAVLARRLLVHACLGRGHGQRFFRLNQLHQSPHLGIGDHLTSRAHKGLDYGTTNATFREF